VAVAAAVAVVADEETPLWSGPVTVGAVVVAAVLAWHRSRLARPWAVLAAAALAGLGAIAGSHSDAWWAVALAGAGLSVAAVVDALERRVPTTVAHGTTVVSGVVLLAIAAGSGRWDDLGVAAAATGFVVLIYGSLWFVRALGLGDVRLAAATLSAGPGGLAYVSTMLFVPAVALGVAGLVQFVVRRRITALPMGPALVAGWLVALGSLPR
jgi:prepilin signal peptidase PulO-like enzyme (type II secretory pathway)